MSSSRVNQASSVREQIPRSASNAVINRTKSRSTEGLDFKKSNVTKSLVKATKSKNSVKEEKSCLFGDRDINELKKTGELDEAFDKFWKSVTAGMNRYPQISVPKNTPIDNKISEMQKRIKLNKVVLQSANERMKNITFQSERRNLSQWRETNLYHDDPNRFKDVKALDLEMEKLRQQKTDRKVFLKASPGIANFHKTMESTLNMLDKIQNRDEFSNCDASFRQIKNEFNLDVIKAPDMVAVSDEE